MCFSLAELPRSKLLMSHQRGDCLKDTEQYRWKKREVDLGEYLRINKYPVNKMYCTLFQKLF